MRAISLVLGVCLLVLSVTVDFLIDGDPGFGLFQLGSLLLGLGCLVYATIFWRRFRRLAIIQRGPEGYISVQLRKGLVFTACMALMVIFAMEFISWMALRYFNSASQSADSSPDFWRENIGPPVFKDSVVADQVYRDLEENLTTGYMPYYEWRADPNQALQTISINSDGFRGPPIRHRRKQVRVLLCGGSVAWGCGATAEGKTLRACLELELASRFPKIEWEVICLAERAFVLRQERIRFELEGLVLGAQYAIFVDGFNDSNAMLMGIRLGDHFRTKQFSEQLKSFKKKRAINANENQASKRSKFLENSQLNTLRLIGELAAKLAKIESEESSSNMQVDHPSGTPADLVKYVEAEIRSLDALAASHSMRIAMVLQPVIYTKPTLSENEQRIMEFYQATNGEEKVQLFRECYGILREFYSRKIFGEKTVLLDHSHILDDQPLAFFDYCHISDTYYKQWATQLVDDLESKGWFEKAPSEE